MFASAADHEWLPEIVVVRRKPRLVRWEVHAAQADALRPLELPHRGVDVPNGELRQSDVPLRLDGAHVRQPLVVDVSAETDEFWVVGRLVPKEPEGSGISQSRKRNGFVVRASVEDDLGGDPVIVHVTETCMDVSVSVCLEVVPAPGPLPRLHFGEHVPRVRVEQQAEMFSVLQRIVVELLEVLRRAVRPEVPFEPRTDVGVRRNDDEGHGLWTAIRACIQDGHRVLGL